tara:strand:- start:88 stop:4689 length:4602 start_codon:yes stop_codon:yes gene_type:complete
MLLFIFNISCSKEEEEIVIINDPIVVSPSNFSYPNSFNLIEVNKNFSLTPSIDDGGESVSFSISPQNLPSSLNFDSNTGNLSGQFTSPSDLIQYQITAYNSIGSKKFLLSFEVYEALSNLAYLNSYSFNYSDNVNIIPSYDGNANYFSYSGNLPSGVSFNPLQGTFSGEIIVNSSSSELISVTAFGRTNINVYSFTINTSQNLSLFSQDNSSYSIPLSMKEGNSYNLSFTPRDFSNNNYSASSLSFKAVKENTEFLLPSIPLGNSFESLFTPPEEGIYSFYAIVDGVEYDLNYTVNVGQSLDLNLSQISTNSDSITTDSDLYISFVPRTINNKLYHTNSVEAVLFCGDCSPSSQTISLQKDLSNVWRGNINLRDVANYSLSINLDSVSKNYSNSISVSPGSVSLSNSFLTLSKNSILLGEENILSLELRDRYSNKIEDPNLDISFFSKNNGVSEVVFSSDKEYLNGIYSINLIGSKAGAPINLSVNINGSEITSLLPILEVTSPETANNILISNINSQFLNNKVPFNSLLTGIHSYNPNICSNPRFCEDRGIKLYLWDFNNDGVIDSRSLTPEVTLNFNQVATYQIKLQVWDDQGNYGEEVLEIIGQDKLSPKIKINQNHFSNSIFEYDLSGSYDPYDSLDTESYPSNRDFNSLTDNGINSFEISIDNQILNSKKGTITPSSTGEHQGIITLTDRQGLVSKKKFSFFMNQNIISKESFSVNKTENQFILNPPDIPYSSLEWDFNNGKFSKEESPTIENTNSVITLRLLLPSGDVIVDEQYIHSDKNNILKFYSNYNNTCIIDNFYSLNCLGDNSKGQLKDFSLNKSLLFNEIYPYRVKDVKINENFICLLNYDNEIYCLGDNQYGQLGNESPSSFESSLQLVPGNFTKFAKGNSKDFICALSDNSEIKCWGNNSYGQFGSGDSNPSSSLFTPSLAFREKIVSCYYEAYDHHRSVFFKDGYAYSSTDRIQYNISAITDWMATEIGTFEENTFLTKTAKRGAAEIGETSADWINACSSFAPLAENDLKEITLIPLGSNQFETGPYEILLKTSTASDVPQVYSDFNNIENIYIGESNVCFNKTNGPFYCAGSSQSNYYDLDLLYFRNSNIVKNNLYIGRDYSCYRDGTNVLCSGDKMSFTNYFSSSTPRRVQISQNTDLSIENLSFLTIGSDISCAGSSTKAYCWENNLEIQNLYAKEIHHSLWSSEDLLDIKINNSDICLETSSDIYCYSKDESTSSNISFIENNNVSLNFSSPESYNGEDSLIGDIDSLNVFTLNNNSSEPMYGPFYLNIDSFSNLDIKEIYGSCINTLVLFPGESCDYFITIEILDHNYYVFLSTGSYTSNIKNTSEVYGYVDGPPLSLSYSGDLVMAPNSELDFNGLIEGGRRPYYISFKNGSASLGSEINDLVLSSNFLTGTEDIIISDSLGNTLDIEMNIQYVTGALSYSGIVSGVAGLSYDLSSGISGGVPPYSITSISLSSNSGLEITTPALLNGQNSLIDSLTIEDNVGNTLQINFEIRAPAYDDPESTFDSGIVFQ